MSDDTTSGMRARMAVDEILKDLCDRRGLKHEWQRIDPEIQDEIRTAWEAAVRKQIDAAAAPKGENP